MAAENIQKLRKPAEEPQPKICKEYVTGSAEQVIFG
jgi:hypothetical protein